MDVDIIWTSIYVYRYIEILSHAHANDRSICALKIFRRADAKGEGDGAKQKQTATDGHKWLRIVTLTNISFVLQKQLEHRWSRRW